MKLIPDCGNKTDSDVDKYFYSFHMFIELILFITSCILLAEDLKGAAIGVVFPLIHLVIVLFKYLVSIERKETRMKNTIISNNVNTFDITTDTL